MNSLPLDLLEEILFRLESKSRAMMRCTDKFFQTYLSDPKFGPICPSWVRPYLFNFFSYGSSVINCQPLVSSCDSMSHGNEAETFDHPCYIFGSCCGLLLLSIGALFVANPLTKKFRCLNHIGSKLLSKIICANPRTIFNKDHIALSERAMCVGFAVNRNQTSKRFKIVCIHEIETVYGFEMETVYGLEMETVYGFEISNGDVWRLLKKTITVNSKSDLMTGMRPVYLNNTLHWLRKDGSIIAFNTETEQASFIPSVFHPEPEMKMLFAPDDEMNLLALISLTKEEILVYTLLDNTKWTLARRIKNVFVEESVLDYWQVAAYDGKLLVLSENKTRKFTNTCVFHTYNVKANSWGVLGSLMYLSYRVRVFLKFTPSFFSIEEDEKKKRLILPSNDPRISTLTAVMGLIDTPK